MTIVWTIVRYGDSFEVLDSDVDYQRSVSFSIMQIGEHGGALSEDFRKAAANLIQRGPMKAMRNPVAHNYGSKNREIIRETAAADIPALETFCSEVLNAQNS